jgi:hypothetical protein
LRPELRAEALPRKDIIWATDMMVLKLKKGENGQLPKIEQFIGGLWTYTWNSLECVHAASSGEVSGPNDADQYEERLIHSYHETYFENGY